MGSVNGVMGEILGRIVSVPFIATAGACIGYSYGLFAHLPRGAVAKAWAVWAVAEQALMALADLFIQNPINQSLMKAAITIISGTIGIYECRKRGLLGPKMMIALIVVKAALAVIYLGEAGDPSLQVPQKG